MKGMDKMKMMEKNDKATIRQAPWRAILLIVSALMAAGGGLASIVNLMALAFFLPALARLTAYFARREYCWVPAATTFVPLFAALLFRLEGSAFERICYGLSISALWACDGLFGILIGVLLQYVFSKPQKPGTGAIVGRVLAGAVLAAVLGFTWNAADMMGLNPVMYWKAERAIERYLSETSPQKHYTIGRVDYDLKQGNYHCPVTDPDDENVKFVAYYEIMDNRFFVRYFSSPCVYDNLQGPIRGE